MTTDKKTDPIKPLLGRLDTWLAKHRRRFMAGLRPGASTTEVAALEKELGLAVPAELRVLLGWHNGQGEDFIGKFEENWELMSSQAIAAAKKELDKNAASTGWKKSWLPFLDNDAGDYLFLDSGTNPASVRAFWLGEGDKPVAPSLEKWLHDFVDHVEKGKYHEDPERGTFMQE